MNWFRRDDDGGFLWPGFGENSRVLKWVIERLEGTADAVETPIGHVPTADSLDVSGLDMTREQVEQALAVNPEEWREEIPQITEWFEKFGDKLPQHDVGRAGDPEEPPRMRRTPCPPPLAGSRRALQRGQTRPGTERFRASLVARGLASCRIQPAAARGRLA